VKFLKNLKNFESCLEALQNQMLKKLVFWRI